MKAERWDVFVSYGHEDAAWVGMLAANLHRDGFDVFLDEWEIAGGDVVTGRLEAGLRGSSNGVLVVSPHALSRPWVREEYAALLDAAVQDPARRLIPVLYLDAELPPFLGTRKWIDFRAASSGPAYDAKLDELERALRGEPTGERPPRDEPRQWPTGPGGVRVRPSGPMRLSLVIEDGAVSLRDGEQVRATAAARLSAPTIEAVKELHRLWHRGTQASETKGSEVSYGGMLADVGRRLTGDLLVGEVGPALAAAVGEAAQLGEILELGVRAGELAGLPLETLQLPEASGRLADPGGTPLVLDRNVALYRELSGNGPVAAHKVPGPLRILVAIASPESQNASGELLNYEAELARIVKVVDPARRAESAHVRVLPDGSLAAIRAALTEEPEGFHVLHLSCHAHPGELLLEREDGTEDRVSARRLLDEAVPAGADLPMVVLSGCSTGLAARRADGGGDGEGEQALGAVAEQLLAAGVPAVVAMQAPVSDGYATELAGLMYEQLAAARASPDPLVALSEARRVAETARQKLPAEAPRRGRPEWATPALWVRGLRLPLFNPAEAPGATAAPAAPVLADGIVVRKVGEFIGRRRELRVARRAASGGKPGIVVHGIGGVGKSTLAAEIVAGVAGERLVVSMRGVLSIDRILDEVGASLGALLPDRDELAQLHAAAAALRVADVEWADRWRKLAEVVLPAVPLLVLLDNFEDNLLAADGGWSIRDPELADLLARWVRRPGASLLLLTSRHPFVLPERADGRLERLHLGPLSWAETAKLMWQLPGLDGLPAEDRLRAYRDVGGHPRTLEYLDALLRGGAARFDDVAERMEDRLAERGIDDPRAWMATRERDADSALAEAVTLAVDDVVLGDLLDGLAETPLAREVAVGASVYRVPVDDIGLVWQLADEEEPPPDAAREARMAAAEAAIAEAAKALGPGEQPALEHLGLTSDELATFQADLEALRRPPVAEPAGFARGLRAARDAGLIAEVAGRGGKIGYVVHRWTARALGQLEPQAVALAHHRAARYWRWRVEVIAQSESEDVEQLLEARHHHHLAGEHVAAIELSDHTILKLRTWGQYGRAAELCRETLGWVRDDTGKARYVHQLGILAQLRGDYDTAEQHYTRALDINQRLGDQAGLANSYGQLGILAQLRGDYNTAERHYTQALDIHQRLEDHAGVATGYHQLGILAQLRGDHDTAEQRYTQSLDIEQRLGNQAGLASSYGQLGILAQLRGDYDTAEQRYTQSLDINQRLGDQAGLATGYHQLGTLAQLRGDYDTAEQRYTQSLDINQRLGDQAGLAAGYHQLGRLAQLRGDYDTAEQRYTQSLDITQRLGDHVGLATSHVTLGSLMAERGDVARAIGHDVAALAIYLHMRDKSAGLVAARLGDARARLGRADFERIAAQHLDEESAATLGELLDGLDQRADAADPGGG